MKNKLLASFVLLAVCFSTSIFSEQDYVVQGNRHLERFKPKPREVKELKKRSVFAPGRKVNIFDQPLPPLPGRKAKFKNLEKRKLSKAKQVKKP